MYYKIHGETGEPVLFIPGTGMPGLAWLPYQVPALLEAGYRPITVDGRGVGRTQATPAPYTIDQLTEDFIELIETLGLGPVHAVGLSQGTFIAENMALRRPDLLRSAVMMGGVGDTTVLTRVWAESWRDLLPFGSKLPDSMFIADDLAQGLPGPTLRDNDEVVRSWQKMVSSREGLATPGMLGQYFACNDWILKREHCRYWAQIDVRTLVIAFEHDLRWPPRTGRAAAAAMPNGEFRTIIGAGHTNAIFDHHEDVNDAIVEFLLRSSQQLASASSSASR
ncbi:alpha/beta hydrolase [Rhodococcus maanshanensis]|uniref:alpha/beta fold hydrolase n=1 Tax=Rhodococcus maanshanensis TaxID=183556 RepID=UPI0022B2B6C8|nr:alpha/beta hydrolase [Rhodococcus maanshanensis]MCZ4556594.1 alpha/beta hydrolase [Rhodococcus maanshanensis]